MGVVGVVAQGLMGYMGDRGNYKAMRRAQEMKAQNAIKTMNYSFQKLETQRRDAFETTIENLNSIQLQNRFLKASVDAALNEEIGEGRTQALISRATDQQGLRAMTQAKDNYKRVSNEIDLNKELAYENMRTYIQGLELPNKPSLMTHAIGMYSGYVSHRAAQEQIDLLRKINLIGVGDKQDTLFNYKSPWEFNKYNTIYSKMYPQNNTLLTPNNSSHLWSNRHLDLFKRTFMGG